MVNTNSKGYYKLTKNPNAHQPYHWSLYASNNEIILTSENYASKQAALKGIESCREHSPYDMYYERKDAINGKPMFNLRAKNHQVIGTSQQYSSEDAREAGIEAVKKYGANASLEDKTGESHGHNSHESVKPVMPNKPWVSL